MSVKLHDEDPAAGDGDDGDEIEADHADPTEDGDAAGHAAGRVPAGGSLQARAVPGGSHRARR